MDPKKYVGRASQQVEEFLDEVILPFWRKIRIFSASRLRSTYRLAFIHGYQQYQYGIL